MTSTIKRLRIALGLVGSVAVAGVIGYRITGLGWMEAIYMTVITVTTVGYREVGGQPSIGEQIFTIVIITTGVSTVLYTFTLGVQTVVEGQLREFVGRRRMNKVIEGFRDHTIVCGLGRVGQTVVDDLVSHGETVVIVDESFLKKFIIDVFDVKVNAAVVTINKEFDKAGSRGYKTVSVEQVKAAPIPQ